jgi:shikimate dehydrogenase
MLEGMGERVERARQGAFAVGLVGAGIRDSLSPALHEGEAALLGLDYSYRLFDLDELGCDPSDVDGIVREANDGGLRGLNVGYPCKQLVVSCLDELSPEAAELGAVNTIVFTAGRKVGHNTDSTGFQEAFARGLPDARVDRVVQVGAGGAGAAVAHAMLSLGARGLTVLDADPKRAAALVEALGRRNGRGIAEAAHLDGLAERLAEADGLIHATPTGMAKHPGTAVPAELLAPRLWVAELVYTPIETRLLREARERGCRTLDGAAMVALQAAGSLELFTGARPDRDRMLRHVRELVGARRRAA